MYQAVSGYDYFIADINVTIRLFLRKSARGTSTAIRQHIKLIISEFPTTRLHDYKKNIYFSIIMQESSVFHD